MMISLSEKILARLKVLAAVVAVAVVAVAGMAGGTRVAYAEGLAPESGYYQDPLTPVDGETIEGPGFTWVPEDAEGNTRGTGYYRIYDPTAGTANPGGHDAAGGWQLFALASRNHTFDGYLVVLDSSIDFSDVDWNRVSDDSHAFTVGSEDTRFSGTFDGAGNTLSGLSNERSGLQLQMDNGFFGWVNEATIKNVNFKDCYVGSTYRGGLVAGYAQDSFFLNITAEDCTTSVIPANNVLNLITNAGISGGTIAGVANGCTLYNCEMRAGRVVTNATAGVAALGGQPLYMGGLVGQANDATIEYCRVTDKVGENGDRVFAQVQNRYDTAVSVANYSEVFTGGIVGCMQGEDTGSKIVDCYSTADVYSYAAIRFAVGLGLGVTRGYTGGIAGIVRDDGDGLNLIERVSYAGNLRSYNYNIILLGIPAIEYDKYMGGITGRGGNNATINQAYFMRHPNGAGMGSSTSEDIYAVKTTYNGGYSDGAAYGPRDESYASREFWEGCDFDMAGGTLRNVGYEFTPDATADEWNESHYNKWVMDYDRGIPVHGGSVKATMDFPGSGSVTIGETSLASDALQTTDDPYDFAVQGYEVSKDDTIEVTYNLEKNDGGENESWADDATNNKGYRFMGWYLNRETRVNDIDADHSLFTEPNTTLNAEANGEKAVIDDEHRVGQPDDDGTGATYTLSRNAPVEVSRPGDGEYGDNDLYLAYAQANVLLHDAAGNVIHHNEEGSVVAAGVTGVSDDWYDYQQSFVLPSEVPGGQGVQEGDTLIGWTTRSEYKGALTWDQLENAKNDGVFYELGSTYVVDAPANLYPVYSNYKTNAVVIFEGHERVSDGQPDVLSHREGYGDVKVQEDANGNLYLAVVPSENSPILNHTVRFLGWYENVGSEDAQNWVRISAGSAFPDGVQAREEYFKFSLEDTDLTQQHTYMARFEYQVTYYYYADSSDIYAQEWVQYGSYFNDYDDLYVNHNPALDSERNFDEWRLGYNCTDVFVGDAKSDNGADWPVYGSDWQVHYPLVVHGHWEDDLIPSGDDITAATDFPGSGDVSLNKPMNLRVNASLAVNPGYNWKWWELSKDGSFERFDVQNPDFGLVVNDPYRAVARMTADVNFKFIDNSTQKVERRYQESILRDSDYTWHLNYYYGGESGALETGSTKGMDDKARNEAPKGYIFLGWMDQSAIRAGEMTQSEWDYVFAGGDNLGNDIVSTGDAARALPYLITKGSVNENSDAAAQADATKWGDRCYRTMTLYPVYAKFDIETTTNIAEAGVPEGAGINVPTDPSVEGVRDDDLSYIEIDYNADGHTVLGSNDTATLYYDAAGNAQIKIKVDTATKVTESEDTLYELTSLEVRCSDGSVETIAPDADDSDTFTYQVRAGLSYTFVANYEPIAVVYHVAPYEDASDVVVTTRNEGEVLGNPPDGADQTTVDENFQKTDSLDFFWGWTEQKPAEDADYVSYTDDVKLVSTSTRVEGAMELWPVYRAANINVKVYYDDAEHVEPQTAYAQRNGDAINLVANDKDGYQFEGWHKGSYNGESCGTRVTGDDRFAGNTYVAVYTKVHEVRYHDTEGNVIYTAKVSESERRTFYQTIQDADGTSVDSIIDYQAFVAINDLLNSNEPNEGGQIERFLTWQLANEDGTYTRWTNDEDSFTHQLITRDMDLYPVTVKMSATDASDQSYTSKLDWSATVGDEGASATIRITEAYAQDHLDVYVHEVSYTGSAEPVVEPAKSVPVSLYMQDGVHYSTETTNADGWALFSFEGTLRIEKRTSDADAAGKTFLFTVDGMSVEGAAYGEPMSLQIPVTLSDKPDDQGFYVGTIDLQVPYGAYSVTESGGPTWRYDVSYSDDEDAQEAGAQVSVYYSGADIEESGGVQAFDPTVLTVTNERREDSSNWLSDDYRVTNVFDKDGITADEHDAPNPAGGE